MSYNPPFHKKIYHGIKRELAKYWINGKKAIQIGITGSQGKTNTSHILYKILETQGQTVLTDTNMDTIYNIPITALRVKSQTQYIIWELGIDKLNEMNRHLEIAKPSIGIITGVSAVHADKEHMGSLENVIKEKRKLVEALPEDGFAILNWDDTNVRAMSQFTKAHILYFGSDKENCDIVTTRSQIRVEGSRFWMQGKLLGEIECSTGLIGTHHKSNIMAVLLVAQILKLPLNKCLEIISAIAPLEGRMSIQKGPLDTLILDDMLRANPASTKTGLETLSILQYDKGRKIAVLNEMGELEDPELEHKAIGQLFSKLNIDALVCIGPLQKYTAEEAKKSGLENVFYMSNVIEAGKFLQGFLLRNDLVYIKGSLLRHSERILMILNKDDVRCDVGLCNFYHKCSKCIHLKKKLTV
jgi:UDP-N-acetylmuramoyl-tripeptide--D-alanyl-D-alanine ligase